MLLTSLGSASGTAHYYDIAGVIVLLLFASPKRSKKEPRNLLPPVSGER
jgi:hypothetical protein